MSKTNEITSTTANAAINMQIKQEKIDLEIEQRIKVNLQIKRKAYVKAEATGSEEAEQTIIANASNSSFNSSTSSNQIDQKEQIGPVKSSNEILAELFGVFNAVPPDEVLNDDMLLRKNRHNKKKHKNHKRIKIETKEVGNGIKNQNNDREADVDGNGTHRHQHKHKKKKKHKHKAKLGEEQHKRRKSQLHCNKTEIKIEDAKKIKITLQNNNNCNVRLKEEATASRDCQPTIAKIKNNLEDDETSEISLSDEESYLQERALMEKRCFQETKAGLDNFYGVAATKGRGRSELEQHKTHTHKRSNPFRRSHSRDNNKSRRRSRSPELHIDKKKLLEVARKNAISMFKRGSLPNCANMTEDVKDQVLLNLRYGGRTVQDLTDFCRKISNGEHLSDLSSNDSSDDIDPNGNPKAFHHPFQLKEREPIVLNLRQSKPLPLRSTTQDQTKAITMQFPVSSGQHHRLSEGWQPVEARETLPSLPVLPTATQSTNIFKSKLLMKNVFQKPIPTQEQQQPAFRAIVNETTTTTDDYNTIPNAATAAASSMLTATQVPQKPSSALPSKAPLVFVPEVAIPSTSQQQQQQQQNSVFPTSAQQFDVSNIISQRLEAMRRLQENPNDRSALQQMNTAQQEMCSWAASKHLPGQFTGSTGANILKTHQLSAGPQAWARRDQLTSTTPVNGGMGMRMLQKMGWKPGEGLGSQKQGSLQPLLIDVKLDKRGLKAREDYETSHQTRANASDNKSVRLAQPIVAGTQNIEDKHPVCLLNELTSKRKWTPPLYEIIDEKGPSHRKNFKFSVAINGQVFVPPMLASTKKDAKFHAARFCLQQMGILPNNPSTPTSNINTNESIVID